MPGVKKNIKEEDEDQDFDYRQKFYELMSKKIAEDGPTVSESPSANHSLRLYRRLVINFLIFTVILVAVVTYYSLMSLTIAVTPKTETLPGSFVFKVCGTTDCQSQGDWLKGAILKIEAEDEQDFPALSEEALTNNFSAQVRLINTTNNDQPLVKTTRLLSSDNKLFRLKEGVVVGSNSELKTSVYSDKTGPEMAIGPDKFTIPGLNTALQAKIYAQSDEPFTYASSGRNIIGQSDFDRAEKEIVSKLLDQAEGQSKHDLYDAVAFRSPSSTISAELVNNEIGDVADVFRLRAKNVIQAAYFTQADLEKSLKKKVSAGLPMGQNLVSFSQDGFKYEVLSYDEASDTASVKIDFSAQIALNNSDLIDRDKLVNLNQQQLEDYLKGEGELESFELMFSPGFIHRAPCSADKIKVEFN